MNSAEEIILFSRAIIRIIMVSLEQEGPALSAPTQADWNCGAIPAGMHPIIWMAIGVMTCTETAERDVT